MPDPTSLANGRYQIQEKIGEGGSATVYKGFDIRLDREVAVKIIALGETLPEERVASIRSQARALARLMHPNLVSVHDFGFQDGSFYLVFDYLPNGTLRQKIQEPIHYHRAARLLAPVVRALEQAHRQGITHGDLRLENILMTEAGEPMLSDTGVALILKTLATQPDGTQVALPAEDPALREDKTAFAKDIHDLGLIFFDLLAHTPFDPDDPSSPSSQLHKILRSRSSAKRPPDLPREVLIFINKVFAYKEFSPYESISKLAADLEKIVLGTFRLVDIAKQVPQPSDRPLPRKTTRIFEVTYDELIEKPKVKQKGVVLWVLLALAGFLLLTFATALVLPRQTTLIFLNTMGLIDTSTPTMSPTIRIVSSSTPTSSRTPAPTLTATLYFTPTPSLTPTITLTYTPMFEKISINNAARISQRVRIDISGGNSVLGLAFSPDSQLIAAALEGGSAILYHVRDGTSLTSLNQTISCIAWSPDGKMIAGGGADGSIYIWSMPDAALVRTLSGHHEAITSLAFSPDSQTLASGSADDTVRLWPMGSTSAPRVLYGHTGDVTSVSFSANGAVLASGSLDTTMRLYSGSGDYLRFLTSEHHILSVALSPDGTRLLAASTNSSIRLFDVANIDRAGLLNVVLEGPGNDTTLNRINSVAFSPDGLIAVIGMEHYVRMENSTLLLVYIEGNRYLKSWAGHTKSVNSVTFSPDGTMLASGSTDGTLRIWGIVR